jgi:hypothetical protein
MEWLVQEVLNFQCYATTIHHFLWYGVFFLHSCTVCAKLGKMNEKLIVRYFGSNFAGSI